ncbi:Gfo/Idh/MocA family protein [Pseudarthrobacter sp. NamB4]|uniref:Gfo/Idh/MocA family protein n=1 Tax=Pseudarthrobacter sp. NamB4 TaxID=2576837 RepID=UPI0010FD86F7|nr:Gfo/Idh/MocA family oxidoreductase [Pseudarthrobacter sp. NamB4]TLM72240.1 Gfo/Idh/MocA family oxidoreductase [Pseudarthrobacter sp. NamB4]
MISTSIRVAVVGAGDFGRRHIAVLAALPEFELVAVADRNEGAARESAQLHGARPFSSLEAVLAQLEIDAVVIATPPAAHVADLFISLDKALPVLVEKPVATSEEDLARLENLPSPLRQLVLPGHISRYLPSFCALRERMSGESVRAIRAVRYVPRERVAMHGESHPALSAMVHDFDLIRALAPSELVHVSSVQSWIDPARPHPQAVFVHLRFADGTIASVDNLWTLPHSRKYIDARLEVSSDETLAVLSLPGGEVSFAGPAGDYSPAVELEGSVYGVPAGALANQLRYFAAHVRGTVADTAVTLEDALWSVRLALQVQRQASDA